MLVFKYDRDVGKNDDDGNRTVSGVAEPPPLKPELSNDGDCAKCIFAAQLEMAPGGEILLENVKDPNDDRDSSKHSCGEGSFGQRP